MATVNGRVTKKRHASANRTRAQRPASARLGKQAKELAKDLQEMGGAAKDAAQEKLGQLRGTASEYCEQGRDKVLHAKHTVGQIVRGLPIKSVLIAAGVGLVLGSFWTIRRR